MYLSKLTFTSTAPVVMRAHSDLHAMHRLLLQGFPDREDGGPGRVLYRVERPRRLSELPYTLVQSLDIPNWQTLEDFADIERSREWEPAYTTSSKYRFRLRATPTVVRTFGSGTQRPGKRRIGLYEETEQRSWINRKATEHGFAIRDLQITPLGKLNGRSPRDGLITHYGVDFDGVLAVTDPAALAMAVAGGIGPAKGFGFGLLSLARAA